MSWWYKNKRFSVLTIDCKKDRCLQTGKVGYMRAVSAVIQNQEEQVAPNSSIHIFHQPLHTTSIPVAPLGSKQSLVSPAGPSASTWDFHQSY